MRKYLLSIILAVGLAPAAQADVLGTVSQKLDAVWGFLGSSEPETGMSAPKAAPVGQVETAPIARIDTGILPRPVTTPTVTANLAALQIPDIAVAAAPAKPSVEMPLKKLFCVEYARAVSGLAIFGDAKFWWARAKNLYARASHPLQEAVMVFSGTARLRSGHVAVVTDILSPREIRVEQANWMNKGEIDHGTPVLDVSSNNDWSKVRVWDMRSGGFGAHVYPISGFILKPAQRQASND